MAESLHKFKVTIKLPDGKFQNVYKMAHTTYQAIDQAFVEHKHLQASRQFYKAIKVW